MPTNTRTTQPKSNQTRAVAVLLILLAVLILIRMPRKRASAHNKPNGFDPPTYTIPPVPHHDQIDWPAGMPRDPFAMREPEPSPESSAKPIAVKMPEPEPVDWQTIAERDLTVASVMIGEVPIAVINAQLIREQDTILGYRVIKITRHAITLTRDKQTITLSL